MTERPSLPRTTHAAEYTDPLGNRVRIEVERVRGIGSLDGESLMGALWEAVSGVWAHTGHGSSPVAVLADHEWHGSDFEQHINPPIDETRRESARELLLDLDYTHEQIDTILRGDATPARLQEAGDE